METFEVNDLEPRPFQYIDRDLLLRLRSYETDDFQFNRALTDDFIANMGNLKLTLMDAFSHKQFRGPYAEVIRCVVVVNAAGGIGTVDMPIEDWLALPTA